MGGEFSQKAGPRGAGWEKQKRRPGPRPSPPTDFPLSLTPGPVAQRRHLSQASSPLTRREEGAFVPSPGEHNGLLWRRLGRPSKGRTQLSFERSNLCSGSQGGGAGEVRVLGPCVPGPRGSGPGSGPAPGRSKPPPALPSFPLPCPALPGHLPASRPEGSPLPRRGSGCPASRPRTCSARLPAGPRAAGAAMEPRRRGPGPAASPATDLRHRFQALLRSARDIKPGSLVSQRIAKVRQGSPAQRSEGLQVGDRLEGVGGRSIFGAAPRDIGDLFRRAGTTLRLRILPHGETGASRDSDAADIEVNDSRMPHCVPMVSSRGPISQSTSRPQESGRYVVELHRGPKGFGFSLRGGSEHNMDIFVLGLMEGGPAQRSGKIQVSDQLMEINGQPTGGMTHAQAVEHIRNGGSRISLVLRRGNGAVPGYGRGRASDGSGPEGDAGRGPPPPSPAPRPRARPRPGPGRSDRAAEERATPREPRGDKPGPGARSREGEGETEAPGARDPGRRATLETSPGPWLVPSKERVSQALRSPGCPQKDPRRSGGTPAKAGRPEGGVESQTGPLPAASLGLGHTSAPARAVEEAVLPL